MTSQRSQNNEYTYYLGHIQLIKAMKKKQMDEHFYPVLSPFQTRSQYPDRPAEQLPDLLSDQIQHSQIAFQYL
jgi:hypothetical protein